QFGIDRPVGVVCNFNFPLILVGGGPAQQALEGTQTGVQSQVNQGINNGAPEQVQPPARHGVVVFLDAIVGVTCRLRGLRSVGLALTRCVEQPTQSEDRSQDDH